MTLGSVSITTAATHVRVLCMRYCNGLIAYILLHYLMKFHLEITRDKEMTTFLYVLSDHPTYLITGHQCFVSYFVHYQNSLSVGFLLPFKNSHI